MNTNKNKIIIIKTDYGKKMTLVLGLHIQTHALGVTWVIEKPNDLHGVHEHLQATIWVLAPMVSKRINYEGQSIRQQKCQ